jgi:hypothetical protein
MSSHWEGVVSVAREVDDAYARGKQPDVEVILRLARAVLGFQQHLAAMRVSSQTRLKAAAASPPAPGE